MRRPTQVVEFVILKKTVVGAVVQGNKNDCYSDSRGKRSEPG
jgi:hypothetical protein